MATLAEYRLALRAPVEWAAPTIADGAGLFTIGPLTEVIAQEHSWQELADVLAPGPAAGVIAHERVLRGEPVDAATVGRFPAIEMPYQLAAVGAGLPPGDLPRRRRARHRRHRYRRRPGRRGRPPPPRPSGSATTSASSPCVSWWSRGRRSPTAGPRSPAWSDRSTTRSSALGVGSRRTGEISLTEALSWLAWAGASGGAHGRRRGAALGRFGALWTLAALLDLVDDWPLPLDELGDIAGDLRWHWWDAGEPFTGWRLQLAVEDRVEGLAWAISARDDV